MLKDELDSLDPRDAFFGDGLEPGSARPPARTLAACLSIVYSRLICGGSGWVAPMIRRIWSTFPPASPSAGQDFPSPGSGTDRSTEALELFGKKVLPQIRDI
jgi:hypothetical protein